MEYVEFCHLLDQMKSHLTGGTDLSMEEMLAKAKSHERWRNVVALYSLRSAEHFYILLRQSNDDPALRQILFDLHSALRIPEDQRLRPLARMLRHLPFYKKMGEELDCNNIPRTAASRQINKLLRSLDRLHRLRVRKYTDEKSRYIAERRNSVNLIKR